MCVCVCVSYCCCKDCFEPSAWLNGNVLAQYLRTLQWWKLCMFMQRTDWNCLACRLEASWKGPLRLLPRPGWMQFAWNWICGAVCGAIKVPARCFMSCPQNAVNMPGEQPARRHGLHCPAMSFGRSTVQKCSLPVNGWAKLIAFCANVLSARVGGNSQLAARNSTARSPLPARVWVHWLHKLGCHTLSLPCCQLA